jgi:hypothetical protein
MENTVVPCDEKNTVVPCDEKNTSTKDKNDQSILMINDIENGNMTSLEIMEKYNLSKYKYYKILNEFGIKNPCMKTGPKGPTGVNSHYKSLLHPTDSADLPLNFNVDVFLKDVKIGLKVTDLLKKYNITLIQYRELRKKHNIKK